jgi:hypothetical protein
VLRASICFFDPDGCLNCPAESVNLANLILDRNRLLFYWPTPIDDLLELVL